MAKTWSLYFT